MGLGIFSLKGRFLLLDSLRFRAALRVRDRDAQALNNMKCIMSFELHNLTPAVSLFDEIIRSIRTYVPKSVQLVIDKRNKLAQFPTNSLSFLGTGIIIRG